VTTQLQVVVVVVVVVEEEEGGSSSSSSSRCSSSRVVQHGVKCYVHRINRFNLVTKKIKGMY
jgi:hypothetical protein